MLDRRALAKLGKLNPNPHPDPDPSLNPKTLTLTLTLTLALTPTLAKLGVELETKARTWTLKAAPRQRLKVPSYHPSP